MNDVDEDGDAAQNDLEDDDKKWFIVTITATIMKMEMLVMVVMTMVGHYDDDDG